MNELVVIVEGETEQTFVRDQLSAYLGFRNIAAWPVLPGRNRNRGGIKKWEVARQDIIRTLRERRYCSTMFDFYAMPADWPGRKEATSQPWHARARFVEQAIHAEIAGTMGGSFDGRFFVPYVQLHEFEALAFSDVKALASVVAPLGNRLADQLAESLQAIVDEAENPEAINDNYDTCPSRRIISLVPGYRKRVHGPIITQRIGIVTLAARCSHFASWLTRLEALGAGS